MSASTTTTTPRAGGGVDSTVDQEKKLNITSPSILKHVEVLASTDPSLGATSAQDLLDYLASPTGNAQSPPLDNDLSYPLPNYYISSSHNTYLSGNQLSSDASAEAYRNVLLRGCRSVEIDVWDGKPDNDSSDDELKAQEGHRGIRERLGLKKSSDHHEEHHRSLKDRLLGHHEIEKTVESPETSRAPQELPADTTPHRIAPWRSGIQFEPRVLHGHTLTKEVPFRKVCEVIRDAAFVTSDLPVVISLEIHTCHEQQQVMVDIMRETWREYLLQPLTDHDHASIVLPSPAELRRKLLIKVKYTAPQTAKKRLTMKEADLHKTNTRTSSDTEAEDQNPTKVKKSKILSSLSDMGIYTRAYSFKGFDKPEARMPTHVFSLSENTLTDAQEDYSLHTKILEHNKRFMMRAYPKALRLTSTNLNPSLFWRQGVQMVALNWQDCDKGMMINEGMFAGTGGYVLKPPSYRSETTHHKAQTRTMDLHIEVYAGQNLALPADKDHESSFHPWVKSSLHVETLEGKFGNSTSKMAQQPKLKVHTVHGQGRNPSFSSHAGQGAVLTYRNVMVDEEQLCFVRLKVVDRERMAKDDLAAWACIRLDRLREGLRIVRLWDASGASYGGLLLVKVSKIYKGEQVDGLMHSHSGVTGREMQLPYV